MKKNIFIFIFIISTVQIASAQIRYIPAGAHPFSISLGGGVTTTFGDLNRKVFKPALRGNLDYNITHFISAGIEGQYGSIAGGTHEVGGRSEGLYSESKFYAVNANIRAGLGEVISKAALRKVSQFVSGLYIGTGIGIVNAEVTEIVRNYPGPVLTGPINGNVIEEANEVLIPINIGLNIELPVYRLSANINLQYNQTFSETLDGYDFDVSSNKSNDAYSMASIVLRYYLGRPRNY